MNALAVLADGYTVAHPDAEPGAGAVNNVTARDVDPVSLQPELKACAVRVQPLGRS